MAGTQGYIAVVNECVLVSQILGLFPYSLRGTQFKRSFLRTAYFLVILALFPVRLLMITPIKMLGFVSNDIQWNVTNFMQAVLTVSCGCTMVFMPFTGNNLNDYLEAVRKSQDAVSGFLKMTFTHKRWDSVAHYLAFLILNIGESQIYDSNYYTYLAWGSFFTGALVIAFVNQFIGMINILRQALVQINENISKMTLESLESAVTALERLSSASEHLNEAHGSQLLLCIGGSFLIVTVNSYLVVVEKSVEHRLLHALSCVLAAGTAWRIVHACVALVNENEEFNNLLGNVLVEEKNFELAESDKLRLHLSMKKKIEFTARGFFSLDYPLINAMFGAVTTYLVILIQFGESSSST